MASKHSSRPIEGLWLPQSSLTELRYGSGCVDLYLLGALPTPASKAVIITGSSIAMKTPLVRRLETILGSHHAGTSSHIRQHGPEEDLEKALQQLETTPGVDTIISLGGGSPIDTAKMISHRRNEQSGQCLTHIAIPTTLSAAECTAGGGYAKPDGSKVGFMAPGLGVNHIFYDPEYARYTPRELWLSTGIKALDHAIECMYHPAATEVPWKALSLWAVWTLFDSLPRTKDPKSFDLENTTRCFLAAFASSGLKGTNLKGGMGLSHALGRALGSHYGIPHGLTSCMTLGKVVQFIAESSNSNAEQIARLLPAVKGSSSGNAVEDAKEVGYRIIRLVDDLGLRPPTLEDRGVSKREASEIVQRVGATMYDQDRLTSLVESLF